MNKTFVAFVLLFFIITNKAQGQNTETAKPRKFGIKGGVNFINITKAESINGSNRNGFMAGVFFSPYSGRTFGWSTELVFSRQGYNFRSNSTTGSVKLDYLLLPVLNTLNITRFVQLQAGGQIGLLLNSNVDSSASPSSVPATPQKASEFFYKLDYGFVGGVEIRPVSGLLVGARLNVNIGSMNKMQTGGVVPPYIPTDSRQLRSNVVQVYAGFHF